MALQIAIEDSNTGVEFNYWRLGNVILFHDKKICKIEIFGYLSRDRYLADKTKHVARQYHVINTPASGEGDDFVEAANNYDTYYAPEILDAEGLNPQKQAYLYLKTLPAFTGATDVDV